MWPVITDKSNEELVQTETLNANIAEIVNSKDGFKQIEASDIQELQYED